MNGLLWVLQGLLASQTLCLALIAGGLLGLGAFTASGLFKTLDRPSAGLAMTKIFRKFDGFLKNLVFAALLCQLVVDYITTAFHLHFLPGYMVFFCSKIVAVALMVVLSVNMNAKNVQLEAMVDENGEIFSNIEAENADQVSFGKLHKDSEKLSKYVFTIALILILWTSLLPIAYFLVK